jgi:hypothetical protein
MYIKILILVLAFYSWHLSQEYLSASDDTNFEIIDRLHDSTFFSKINHFLWENPDHTKYHFILSSLLIDVNVMYLVYNYFRTNNLKTMLVLFTGLICRQFCQYINRLPIPANMIWFDPGFPSILVTYGIDNDFFFSGHTFVALTAGFEIFTCKNYLIKSYGIFFVLYEIFLIVSINGHYFMDIYAAVCTYFMLVYFYEKIFSWKNKKD